MNESQKRFNSREFLLRAVVGLVFVAVLSWPAVWALTKDQPNRLQTLVVYVAIALVAGVTFSVATVSRGSVRWGRLGISLGGGAAIGIATIIAVHRLLPLPPAMVVIQPTGDGSALVRSASPSLRVRRLQDSQDFLVEVIQPGKEHQISFMVVEGDGNHERKYHITEDGRAMEVEAR